MSLLANCVQNLNTSWNVLILLLHILVFIYCQKRREWIHLIINWSLFINDAYGKCESCVLFVFEWYLRSKFSTTYNNSVLLPRISSESRNFQHYDSGEQLSPNEMTIKKNYVPILNTIALIYSVIVFFSKTSGTVFFYNKFT